jgi:uncharacterized delta-60 repeat protein
MTTLRILLLAIPTALTAYAQVPGSNDDTFNTADVGNGQGYGPYIYLTNCAIVQPDDKVIAAGGFRYYNAVQSNCFVRTLPNGNLDTSYHVGLSMNGQVFTLALQADGALLAGGSFSASQGPLIRNRILRLTPDGAIDAAFEDGSGFNGDVQAIAVQPDGMILVGGAFTMYNGTACAYIARLGTDGTLDASFDAGAVFDDAVLAIALQPDGKILAGGAFDQPGIRRVARLNADGSLDPTFTGPNTQSQTGEVRAIALQPDNRIIIAGTLSQNSPNIRRIARLEADGTIDASFVTGAGFVGAVNQLLLEPNGQVVAVGDLDSYNAVPAGGVARLNTDGSLDALFQSGTGFANEVKGLATQSDGALIFAGSAAYNGLRCPDLMRTSPDGSFDLSFNQVSGFNTEPTAVAVQADGGILVGGAQIFNGTVRQSLARLLPSGDLDLSFDPGIGPRRNGFEGSVETILPLIDGRIIVGGWFDTFDGLPAINVVRLLADGAVDPTFTTGGGTNALVERIIRQPDGKLLLMGPFTEFDGVPRNRIARIEADGALDPSFDPGTGYTSPTGTVLMEAMALQPGGKILIGGFFDAVQGEARNMIARLNADGTLDPTFDAGTTFDDVFLDIAVQADGRIMCSGFFENVAGLPQDRIARVMPDGAFDPSFDPGSGFSGSPAEPARMIIQPDGRILVSGAFYSGSSAGIEGIMRYLPDGTVDPDFVSDGFSTNLFEATYASFVPAMAMQADGKVVAVGRFASYNGTGRNGIARFFAYDVSTGLRSGDNLDADMLFPVPNDGQAIWYAAGDGMTGAHDVRVFDAQGRVVHRERIGGLTTGGAAQLVFPEVLGAGVYAVVRTGASGQPHTSTFIVR